MDSAARSGLAARSLSGTWLSTRLGVDRVRLERMARSGELVAYRKAGSQDLRFPAWQFDAKLKPIPALPRLREAARRAGVDDARLCELMEMRVGMSGTERLADLARSGSISHVLGCIALAGPRRPND
jgi:hypothetical protein